MRGGLTRRTIVASGLLAVLVGAAFALLLNAVAEERESARLATRSQQVLAVANALERLVLDLETGQRGFLIAREERFLEPWDAARTAYPAVAAEMIAASRGVLAQERAARHIVDSVDAYVRDYSLPLVRAARRGDRRARSAAELDEGKRRVDTIRREFDRFVAAERRLFTERERRSERDGDRAVALAVAGLVGSMLLIVAFGVYLIRAIVLPVRRASVMAERLAGGDLSTRMPETSTGEIGGLERSFNTMAGSLEAGRDELAASRARVVAAADESRRRIERDLHDGAQQRLTHTTITLKLARRALEAGDRGASDLVDEALEHAERATEELRDLAHGILPAALSRGGLRAGIETLVSRVRLPVTMDVTEERVPAGVEATAYFIVAEALTNTIKHAQAKSAEVSARVRDGTLEVEVRDDGIGGARVGQSSGLLGLQDRAAAMGGELRLHSPPGSGTVVSARLPVQAR